MCVSEQKCTDSADGSRCRRAREADHLLYGKAQFEPMQWVADADLLLYFLVGQRRHDGTALDVGVTCRDVPRRHTHP